MDTKTASPPFDHKMAIVNLRGTLHFAFTRKSNTTEMLRNTDVTNTQTGFKYIHRLGPDNKT